MKFRELKTGDVFYFLSSPTQERRRKIAYRKYEEYEPSKSNFVRVARGESNVVKLNLF